MLKLADLVRVERRGQFQVYSLNTAVFQDLMAELMEWFGGTNPPSGTLSLDETDTDQERVSDA